MSLPKPLSLTFAAITLVAHPANAQDLTAILRINGEVMVSTGGEFHDALDGQPVLPGQRIMVGEGASAIVRFSQDCKRSYNQAGVYTVTPGLCDQDERQRRPDQTPEEAGEFAGGSSPLVNVGIIVGTVIGVPLVADRIDDQPTSR